jgi:hypothetical protein
MPRASLVTCNVAALGVDDGLDRWAARTWGGSGKPLILHDPPAIVRPAQNLLEGMPAHITPGLDPRAHPHCDPDTYDRCVSGDCCPDDRDTSLALYMLAPPGPVRRSLGPASTTVYTREDQHDQRNDHGQGHPIEGWRNEACPNVGSNSNTSQQNLAPIDREHTWRPAPGDS